MRAEWVIFIYLSYSFLNEVLNYYIQSGGISYTTFLFSVYTLVEFLLITYFFYLLLSGNTANKKIILVSLVIFLLVVTPDYLTGFKVNVWDSKAIGLESLLILMYCVIYLYSQLKKSTNLVIYSTFNFWVTITFLLFFAGTFFLNIMAESMRKNPEYQIYYLYINTSFIILKNVLLAFACTRKTIPLQNRGNSRSSTFENINVNHIDSI